MDGFLSQEQQLSMSMYNEQMLGQQMAQQNMIQQQMYSQPMNMQYSAYNQGMNYSVPKLTKGQIIDNLSGYVYNQTGVLVSKVEKIEEMPQTLRHSCVYTGVITLNKFTYSYASPQGYVDLPFFFCDKCGKLYYCPDYLL